MDHMNSDASIPWWDRRRRAPPCHQVWAAWGPCSKTCGYGTLFRLRVRIQPIGCKGALFEQKTCLTKHCPIDCKQSEWSGWGPSQCPVTCGTGKLENTRSMLQAAMYGGRECDDPELNYLEKACGTDPCPIDCLWAEWGFFTDCTTTCGGGTKERSRDRLHSSEHGGTDCPGQYTELQKCNTRSCPIDCVVSQWKEWSPCSFPCGGGERMRLKTVLVANRHGGAECPHVHESETCNQEACEWAGAKRSAKMSCGALVLHIFWLVLVAF